jgi:hypothetical protein
MVDWNKDIEIKIWKVGESFLKKTKGWVNAKSNEVLHDSTRCVEYKAEDGKDHFCFAKRDGSIYGGIEECGKVRNKVTIDWGKPIEVNIWGVLEWTPAACYTLHAGNDGFREVKIFDSNELLHTYPRVSEDGKVWSFDNQIGLVRNKRTVDDNTKKINQKPDNRAVFYFERKGDVYTLKGWKNVMSWCEIEQKYGKSVALDYWSRNIGIGFLEFTRDSNKYVLINNKGEMLKELNKCDAFTKDEYKNIVARLKKAGERLSKLIRDSKKPEKIEVVI